MANTSLFEVAATLTFTTNYGRIEYIPVREFQGSKETLALGEGPYIGASERRINMPMKKPIRLLGMVFQIDK